MIPFRVIHRRLIPTKLPIGDTVIVWLVLDRLQLPGWVDGVMWTIVAFVWALAIFILWNEEQVDVLERDAATKAADIIVHEEIGRRKL